MLRDIEAAEAAEVPRELPRLSATAMLSNAVLWFFIRGLFTI
jgi:hypothetical protein